MNILLLLIGLMAGGISGWLIAKFKFSAGAQSLLLVEQEKTRSLEQDLTSAKQELQSERIKVLELTNNLSTTNANFRNLQEKLDQQKNEANDLQKKFTTEFENLANKILEEKSRKFTDLNKTNLSDLLIPLKEKMCC